MNSILPWIDHEDIGQAGQQSASSPPLGGSLTAETLTVDLLDDKHSMLCKKAPGLPLSQLHAET